MNHYNTVKQLISGYNDLPVPGRVFLKVNDPLDFRTTEFWALSSKEQKDQDFVKTFYGEVPESLAKLEAKSFLDTQTFQDIIENAMENNPGKTFDDVNFLTESIQYYLVEDDFKY